MRAFHDLRNMLHAAVGFAALIEQDSGRIWAESRPGRGSTFRFTLPMHAVP